MSQERNRDIKIDRDNGGNEYISLVKGTLIAFLITSIVFFVYGAMLTYTDTTEDNTQLIVMVTTVVSMIVSGFISARGFNKNGWLYGMIAGFLYAIIIILVGFCILPDIKITSKFIIISVLSLSAGGVGGILGINTRI
ncbi:MAG: TIGR04086 family membrane protein [bacterium]